MSEISKEREFETEDLALAAYLKMSKIEMVDYEYANHKIRFVFKDGSNVCKKLHIQFLNSVCKKFDSEVRDLKKLMK